MDSASIPHSAIRCDVEDDGGIPGKIADQTQPRKETTNYGGIGRLGFFLGIWAICAANGFGISAAKDGPSPALDPTGMTVCVLLLLILAGFRLRNMGSNLWWSLLVLVPAANFYILVKCLVCPKGFRDTDKIDLAGRIIAWLLVGVIVFCLIFGAYVLHVSQATQNRWG